MIDFKKKVPQIFQSESAECGLACVLMVAGYYGYQLDLTSFRNRFSTSKAGATLVDIIQICNEIELSGRALKADVNDLIHVEKPAILHWGFNHFVVFCGMKKGKFEINDPATGRRLLTKESFSKEYTGVVLEVVPSAKFKKERKVRKLSLKQLLINVKIQKQV